MPTAGDLVDGELAANTADGLLFIKDSNGNIRRVYMAPIVIEKSGSFTATYNRHYSLHISSDATITLPAWDSGRSFTVSIDNADHTNTLTFSQPSGEEVNGSTSNPTENVNNAGDMFAVLASGTSSSKRWSITRSDRL